MPETSDQLSPLHSHIEALKTLHYARAKAHARSAMMDMGIIITVLALCITIFVGADRLSEFIFKHPSQRRADIALTEAGAKLKLSLAELADPAAALIKELPEHLRPLLEQSLGLSPTEPPVAPNVPSSPPPKSVRPSPNISNHSSPEDLHRENALLRRENDKLWHDNRSFISTIDTLRALKGMDQRELKMAEIRSKEDVSMQTLANEKYLKLYALDVQEAIEEYKADHQQKIEEQKADALMHQADMEREIAGESTELVREWNTFSATALTRVGAVVLVLFLVRLFIRKRARSVQLAAFYLAVGDSLTLYAGQRLEELPMLLAAFLPKTDNPAQAGESPPSQDMLSLIQSLFSRGSLP